MTNSLRLREGKRFGNGIYFADVAVKSAGYCAVHGEDRIGLMLLCEVALGISREVTSSCNECDIPNDENQSIHGLGSRFPRDYRTIDGVPIASGHLQSYGKMANYDYNEFVIFDPNQVKIKYLLEMEF